MVVLLLELHGYGESHGESTLVMFDNQVRRQRPTGRKISKATSCSFTGLVADGSIRLQHKSHNIFLIIREGQSLFSILSTKM